MRAMLMFAVVFCAGANAQPVPAANATTPVRVREPHTKDAQLRRGEVLVSKLANSGVVVTAWIDAPPEAVWPFVSNCSTYKEHMPNITSSEEVKTDGDVHFCKVVADLPFPLSDLTSLTRATHVVGDGTWTRAWTLVEGDYDKNEGSWTLQAYGDGTSTLAQYRVIAEPKIALPQFIIDQAQQSTLPEMMRNVRAHVMRLKAKTPQ